MDAGVDDVTPVAALLSDPEVRPLLPAHYLRHRGHRGRWLGPHPCSFFPSLRATAPALLSNVFAAAHGKCVPAKALLSGRYTGCQPTFPTHARGVSRMGSSLRTFFFEGILFIR